VREGEKVHFEARISGYPAPKVNWFHNGQPVAQSERYQIIQDSLDLCRLTINYAGRLDAGPIKISAVNSGGEAICIADLLVAPNSPTTRSNQHALSHSLLYLTSEITSAQDYTMVSFLLEKYFKQNFNQTI
jgi:Immunoglobulin I-set domain